MDKRAYTEFSQVEDRHWWFLGRRDIVLAAIRRSVDHLERKRVLDVGCGTGLMLRSMEALSPTVEGLDMEPSAIAYAKASGVRGTIHLGALPDVDLPGPYDLILMLDVLEHIEDDRIALQRIHALLAPGGTLVLTVPAHPFLWSEHDVYNHHKRRYRSTDLLRLLRETGFSVRYWSFMNAFFFLPVALFRLVKNVFRKDNAPSDLFVPPSFINRLCYRIFSAEQIMMMRQRIPFGVSLIAVAEKQDA